MNYSKQFLKKLGEAISDVIEDDKINEPTKYVADKISKWIVNEEESVEGYKKIINGMMLHVAFVKGMAVGGNEEAIKLIELTKNTEETNYLYTVSVSKE